MYCNVTDKVYSTLITRKDNRATKKRDKTYIKEPLIKLGTFITDFFNEEIGVLCIYKLLISNAFSIEIVMNKIKHILKHCILLL